RRLPGDGRRRVPRAQHLVASAQRDAGGATPGPLAEARRELTPQDVHRHSADAHSASPYGLGLRGKDISMNGQPQGDGQPQSPQGDGGTPQYVTVDQLNVAITARF